MGLDISILQATSFPGWEYLEYDSYITILTEKGKFLPENNIYKAFESYFFEAEIEYFDIQKRIEQEGYLKEDLSYEYGYKYIKEGNIESILSVNPQILSSLWKYPVTLDLVMKYEIQVKEGRRYKFWWDYIKSMRTFKQKLSGKLTLNNHPTFKVQEICLYHPQISYQRRGMNDNFYDDNMWQHSDILEKKIVEKHIDKYAENKTKSKELLLKPFVEGKTFLRYW